MSTPATDTVAEPDDTTPLIPPERTVVQAKPSNFLDRTYAKVIITVSFLAVLVLAGGLAVLLALRPSPETGLSAEDITTCAWSTLEDHEWLLNAPPIFSNEFLERQNKLAATLRKEGIDAYIMEPSASSLYYFNISASYSLSERPFLQILSADGSFSYLAPKFELGRMAGLKMVCKQKTVIEWKEEESPYAVLKRELGNGTTKVMVDEQARFFIASGLEAANFTVLPTSPAITSIRSVKTYAEIRILRAINEFTLEVVRSLQPCIRAGVTQEAVLTAARTLFTRAGVGSGFWALVLFGEQAANPHGGSNGKVLEDGEFVLIDIGSKLHGYGSDVTRTILPPHSNISAELMYMWKLVKSAQDSAVAATTEGTACSAVDARSRELIEEKGLGAYYTHRLGHGLGLETHEHPYLNGANNELLKVGQVVSNEPGIYVTDSEAQRLGYSRGFGIRLEDPVLVGWDWDTNVLTGSQASSPWEP